MNSETRRLKKNAQIQALGGKCKMCGETESVVLCIINIPDTNNFQVLCANCNLKYRFMLGI